MVSESDIFGGDACAGTDNLGPYAVSETSLGAVAVWGATIFKCGVNYDLQCRQRVRWS